MSWSVLEVCGYIAKCVWQKSQRCPSTPPHRGDTVGVWRGPGGSLSRGGGTRARVALGGRATACSCIAQHEGFRIKSGEAMAAARASETRAPWRDNGWGEEEECSSRVPAGAAGAKEGAQGDPSPQELSPAPGQLSW